MSQSGSFSSGGIPKNPTFAVLTVTSRLDLNSGATFNLYNTADKTTNYERLRAQWSGNIAQIGTQNGGTGSFRAIRVGVFNGAFLQSYLEQNVSGPTTLLVGGSFSSTAIYLTSSAANSTGTQISTHVNPTLNQSGTAGATILNVDPTVTATGSGTYAVQRWGWGGTTVGFMSSSGVHSVNGLGVASTGTLGFLSSTALGTAGFDLTFARDAADTLALRRGTNAQTDRNYETYTDASNYSRHYRGWSGGFGYIGTQAAGTGTRRPLIVQHFAAKVASLPAAATVGAGSRCFVSDALGPVFGAAVVGGGAVNVPVYSDGANWLVG